MKKLDVARARAREAGIKQVGKDGSEELEFWTYVQLARMLETEHEHAEEDRMNKLMKELNFSQKEVDDFRQVFVEKKKEAMAEQGIPEDAPEPNGMTREAVRRLVRMLGVSLMGDNKNKLDNELKKLGCDEDSLLEFPGFLRLMKWMMDTDFAGVNQASSPKGKR